jgi:hypothetical protein
VRTPATEDDEVPSDMESFRESNCRGNRAVGQIFEGPIGQFALGRSTLRVVRSADRIGIRWTGTAALLKSATARSI